MYLQTILRYLRRIKISPHQNCGTIYNNVKKSNFIKLKKKIEKFKHDL